MHCLGWLVISWPHSGCIRTNPLMCLSNVGCFLWFFGRWKTHTKKMTQHLISESNKLCTQIKMEEERKIFLASSDTWGSMFPKYLWVLGFVQDVLHSFSSYIICFYTYMLMYTICVFHHVGNCSPRLSNFQIWRPVTYSKPRKFNPRFHALSNSPCRLSFGVLSKNSFF